MSDDNNTQVNQNQSRQNIDWTRKGFGWVPDYPDIRDFVPSASTDTDRASLQKEIQKEGVTEAIDDVTNNLIRALDLLRQQIQGINQPKAQTDHWNDLQATLEALGNQANSGVQFSSARVYRVLSKETLDQSSPEKDQNDREQKREILQLKHCLYFLVRNGVLDFDQTPDDEIDWLTKPEFDDSTESLVKQFQAKHFLDIKIREDGSVGLNTFLALEACCANIEKCKQDVCSDRPNTGATEIKNPAKLITISSLVPDQVFSELVDYLYLKGAKSGSPSQSSNSSNILFSSENLIEILQSAKESRCFSRTKTEIFPKLIENKLRKEKIQVTRAQLIKLCKSEFLLIDPIVSVILMSNTPLANQSSIKQFVSQGVQQLEELLDSVKCSGWDKDTFSSLHNTDDLMCLAAVLKAKNTLDVEKAELINAIKNTVQQISNTEGDSKANQYKKEYDSLFYDLYPSLAFYLLIEAIISDWKNQIPTQMIDRLSHIKDHFSKKEHFELILVDQGSSTDQHNRNHSRREHQARRENGSAIAPTTPVSARFFVRPEIPLPVSVASTRLKQDPGKQKVPYFLLPGAVDLSYWCSPVEDQGVLNTCTACAGVGLLEYFAKRTFGEFEDLSPLFLYKAARDLRQRFGDVGAPLRDIMRSMILFGVAPERYWPYRPENLDAEPPTFCYSYAQNYQTLKYFRLDRADLPTRDLLLKAKAVLAAGFPCMFGFTVYTSIYNRDNITAGYIPFPDGKRDRVVGGHAVVAVGYNDYKRIPFPDGSDRAGALLIRNSWGREWGLGGYGWLPYEYVLRGLTGDWWSLLKAEWFGQGYFGLEARDPGGPPGDGQTLIPTTTGR
jgi:C1A family cysteine protease